MTLIQAVVADPRFFPGLISLLNLLASLRYAMVGNWGHALYWFGALILTFSATFLMGGK